MSQQVQELIDKIKSEGIEAAQKKAQEIETAAELKAQEILKKAREQSETMLLQAREEIQKSRQAAEAAIGQAARDTVLALREEVLRILDRILVQNVSSALSPEQLGRIIETAIKHFVQKSSGNTDIRVLLSPADLEQLKKGFWAKLQNELKKPIRFFSSDDIHRGFTISFDGGKSSFDFSATSLAEYLGSYLNNELADLVKTSVK